MVLLGLDKVENPRERYQHEVSQRAIDWIFAMQCRNGGWASFDKDNTRMVFQHIPFADHNAMLDPPTVDITGRVLEMLAAYGVSKEDKRVKKAIKFILSEQEPDGSWFGRWGVNYIYGTMLVLRGLQAMGVDHHEPYVQQGAEWLRMVQNSDGGWGETCGSYDDPTTRGIGPSTPSQTAWAVMGLLAAGDTRSESVQRGILYLLEHAARRWPLGRRPVHGNGLPTSVLPGVSPVSGLFPADCSVNVLTGIFCAGSRGKRGIRERVRNRVIGSSGDRVISHRSKPKPGLPRIPK